MPDRSYIICASPRSGSSLLGEALASTGHAGRPGEFFLYWYQAAYAPERLDDEYERQWLIPAPAYLRKVFEKGMTPNGVFGVKIMWNYFELVIERLRGLPRYRGLGPRELLDKVFPNLHYIHIVRTDKVRQAVSLVKAIQSDKWVDVDPWVFSAEGGSDCSFAVDMDLLKTHFRNASGQGLEYDFDEIYHYYGMFQAQDKAWERYFRAIGVTPYRVVYEDFVRSYEETTVDILKYLGIPLPEKLTFERRFLKRQSDAVNEEWTERFKGDLSRRPSLFKRVLGRFA